MSTEPWPLSGGIAFDTVHLNGVKVKVSNVTIEGPHEAQPGWDVKDEQLWTSAPCNAVPSIRIAPGSETAWRKLYRTMLRHHLPRRLRGKK